MATLGDLTQTLTLRDELSGPATAAAAAMEKAAAAADQVTVAVTKTGRSASSLVNSLLPAERAAASVARAQRDAAQAAVTMSAAVADGSKTQAQANAIQDEFARRIGVARAGLTALSGDHEKAAVSSGNQDFATRQLGVQLTQMFSGIAAGQPVFTTFVQQGHQVADVAMSTGTGFKGLAIAAGALFNAVGGLPVLLGVGVVGGLAAVALHSETVEKRTLAMQAALRGTQENFKGAAEQAERAAKSFAAATSFGSVDSASAATALAAAPQFKGTENQLRALLGVAGDLATMFGGTLPEEARKLAAAMADPGAMAQKLSDTQFRGFNQVLADNVKSLAASGDKAAAFAKLLDTLRATSDGASQDVRTKLQAAIDDLGHAFQGTGGKADGFATVLGHAVTDVAAGAVDKITGLVLSIESAYERIAEASKKTGSPGFLEWMKSGFAPLIPGAAYRAMQPGPSAISSAGAIGTMQLMPGTAAGLGVNPYDQADNIKGGMAYIAQLSRMKDRAGNTQFPSDGAVAGAYNLGPGNYSPLAASGYNAKVAGANIASLPTDVAGQIDMWGQVLGLPPNLVDLGKRIAMVENGGQQGPRTPTSRAAYGPPEAYGPPTAPGGAGYGVVNPPDQILSDALAAAKSSGVSGYTAASAQEDISKYAAALAQLRAEGKQSGSDFGILSEALQKAQVAYADALGPVGKLTAALDRQIAAENAVADAQSRGFAAAIAATNHTKAEAEARSIAAPGTKAYAAAVAALAGKYDELTAAQQRGQAGAALNDQKQELDYLQKEVSLVGANADIRAVELARLREIQIIEKSLPGATAEQKAALIENAEAIARGTEQMHRQQAALQELGNLATQIADQVGNAITQSFISGTGAAVNWGNVTRGILASVAQQALKLAVINPLVNGITGGSGVTLSGVAGALGAASGGGSGEGASGGGLGMLSNVVSLGRSGYSYLNGGGNFTTGISSVDGVIGTQLWGTSAAEAASLNTSAGIEALGAGVYGPATAGGVSTAGTAAASGATVGSLAGGVGLGFAAGSLVGGAVQSSQGKQGPAPTIGAAGGAVAGALIGSLVGPIGTIIGGLIGGIVGGAGGGFIGPGKANAYTSTRVSLQNGRLVVGGTQAQGYNADGERADTIGAAGNLNAFLSNSGARLNSIGGLGQVGQNTPDGYQDPSKFGSVGGAFSDFRFGANDNLKNNAIAGKSFGSLNDLQAVFAAIDSFINTVVPALKGFGKVTGTLNDSVAGIHSTFDGAITIAKQLGYAETDLTALRDKQIKKLYDDTAKAFTRIDGGLEGRYKSASAQISGSSRDSQASALFSFDLQAQDQRDALGEQMVTIFGDAFKTGADYARQMASLERTLGQERLAIAQSYTAQLKQVASASVSSLSDYVLKLQTGSASPLSPRSQYALASSQFDAVAGAAKSGDYTSTQKLKDYADSLLSSSRDLNGSGAAYVADFSRVLDALQQVAGQSADALTASIYAAEMRTQTAILDDGITALRAEVTALRQAVAQGSLTPARVAA